MTNVAKNFSTGSVGRSDLFSQKDVVDAAEFGDLIFTMPETPWDSFEAAFFFPFLDVFRTCCGTTHNFQNCMNKFLNKSVRVSLANTPNMYPKTRSHTFPAPVNI